MAFLDVGAFHANDNRNFEFQFFRRVHHAACQHVATKNTAEDIYENGFHIGVAEQNAERVLHLLFGGPTTHIQEIRRAAATQLDDVHRGHCEASAVDHAADGAVELDVVQFVF